MTEPTAPLPTSGWTPDYIPTARQAALASTVAQEVLFGGASGAGKSRAACHHVINFALTVPGSKSLILRRSFPMLEMELIPRLRAALPPGVASYHAGSHTFTFTNGSTVKCGHLQNAAALDGYQGSEWQTIVFDEATQFPWSMWTYMRSRLRMAGSVREAMEARGWIPRMIATSNPGGVGHSAFKRMFVDASPGPDVVFAGGVEDGASEAGWRSMCYIPATVQSNPHIDVASFVQNLEGLSPDLRRAYLEGDWNLATGTRFGDTFRLAIHVVNPEDEPLDPFWPRACGIDWGMSAPFAAVWGARKPDGTIVILRELVKAGWTIEQQARAVLAAEAPGERNTQRPIVTVLDPSCWSREATSALPGFGDAPPPGSKAGMFRAAGLHVTKAVNNRTDGWSMLDHLLRVRVESDHRPRLLIYSTCRELITELPAAMRDEGNPEDIRFHTPDVLDAARYMVMSLYRNHRPRIGPGGVDYRDLPDREQILRERYDGPLVDPDPYRYPGVIPRDVIRGLRLGRSSAAIRSTRRGAEDQGTTDF